jgi:hypothetical protein
LTIDIRHFPGTVSCAHYVVAPPAEVTVSLEKIVVVSTGIPFFFGDRFSADSQVNNFFRK